MGNTTSHETLALRWVELCNNPLFRDIQAKFELNVLGVMELSPGNNRHSLQQAQVGHAFREQLPQGAAFVHCSIASSDGVRVPDVAWASDAFVHRHGDTTPFPSAPEICVEVRSPSNTNEEMQFKTALFLAAGAVEVWIVDQDGTLHVFGASGPQAASRYGVSLPNA